MWKNILLGLSVLVTVLVSLFAGRNRDINKGLERLRDTITDAEKQIDASKEQAVQQQQEVTQEVAAVELDIKAVHEQAQEQMSKVNEEPASEENINEFMGKRK